jgi:hypothetical protein
MLLNIDNSTGAKLLANSNDAKDKALLNLIGVLMMTTGVFRLYTKDDFRELFKRLAILGKNYNIFEKFFIDNELLKYSFNGIPFILAVSDFNNLIGVVFGKGFKKSVHEIDWIEEIPGSIKNANVAGIFLKVEVFTHHVVKTETTNDIIFRFIDELPAITEDDFKNAELIANSMINDMDDSLFNDWQKIFPNANSDWDATQKKYACIKQFNNQILSDDKKKLIREHFEQFFSPDEWNQEKVDKLIHLAWAYANNHIYSDTYDQHFVEEYIDFDETGLEFEDGGINLNETYDLYSLNDLWDILKEN